MMMSASRNGRWKGHPKPPLIVQAAADVAVQSESLVHVVPGARLHVPRLAKPKMRLFEVSAM